MLAACYVWRRERDECLLAPHFSESLLQAARGALVATDSGTTRARVQVGPLTLPFTPLVEG
jgi:hypothetical protein